MTETQAVHRRACEAAERLHEATERCTAAAIRWLLATVPAPEILLVEPDAAIRGRTAGALQAAFPALFVRTSRSVEEARDFVVLFNPAVVVVDLPVDASSAAQAAAWLPRVPHLILTSRTVPFDQLAEIAVRVRGVAVPFEPVEGVQVARLVETILSVYAAASLFREDLPA